MHSCICCHRLTSLSDGLHILYCAYQRGPSRYWWRGSSSSYVSSAVSSTVGILPLMNFFSKMHLPTLWPFGKISRAKLCYWVFHSIAVSSTCLEETPKFSKELGCTFRASCPWGYVPIFLEVFDFVIGSLVPLADIYLWRSRGLVLHPLVSFLKGYPTFL